MVIDIMTSKQQHNEHSSSKANSNNRNSNNRNSLLVIKPHSPVECCRGWGARLASLGKAVQSRLPGFMAAPSLTTADIPESTAEVNSRTQSAQDGSGGRLVQPWDTTPSAPQGAVEEVLPVSLQEAQELPPVTLMSSTADIIVPWLVNNPLQKLVEQ